MFGWNSNFRSLCVLLTVLVLGGCETYELYDGPEPMARIALNSTFSPDKTWEVRVTRVRSIQEPFTSAGPIDDAEVTVTGGGDTIVLRPRGEGLYGSPDDAARPVAGVRYRLLVRHATLGEASAEDIAPAPPAVEVVGNPVRISTYDTSFGRLAYIRLRLRVRGTDTPHVGVSLSQLQPPFAGQVPFEPGIYGVNFSSPEPRLRAGYEDDAPIRNGNDFGGSAVFVGAFGPTEVREFEVVAVVSAERVAGPDLLVSAFAFSDAAQKHAASRALQLLYADDPFAEPVPIVSNVTGGYGIFGGFNASPDLAIRIPD